MENLIVVNPKDITFHPRNYNRHSDVQVEELARSLDLFDQYKNIVVYRDPDDDTLYVIAGEGLVRAALKRGLSEITVNDRSDLSEDRAMALMLSDNLTPSDDFDPKKTADLVRAIDNVDKVPGVTPDWLVGVLGTDDEGGSNKQPSGDEQPLPEQFMIMIECSSEEHQVNTLEKLMDEGYKCRALLS